MADEGLEEQGTGLRDVFKMLAKLPQERLLSLTFQLGVSPQENIIHALCLIILQRGEQAMNKLQTLTDSHLAKHLVENWQISGGKVEEFGLKCGYFHEFAGESLAELARLFRVLYELRLCDPILRNLAYKRALSSDKQKMSNCNNMEYDQLREEAKLICGPQFEEWMCSPGSLQSVSDNDPHSGLGDRSSTLKRNLSATKSESTDNLPSSLQTNSSVPSYPTHLEISFPPTVSYQGDKVTPEPSDNSNPSSGLCFAREDEAKNASRRYDSFKEPQTEYSECPASKTERDSKVDTRAFAASDCSWLGDHTSQNETPKQTNTIPTTKAQLAGNTTANMLPPKMDIPKEVHNSNGDEEDEEASFYSFVILHAPQDVDMAESMKERLESIVGSEGAIFSEDFAIPGKSTLRCVEDAINNSAFTILLLTRNFNTRMLEMKTDSALINSLNNPHKCYTVIPLLPRENCMPRQSMPMVLQTLVAVEENKNFDRRIQKALSPSQIKRLKRIWDDEQKIKAQTKRQERLRLANQHQRLLIDEGKRAQILEQERLRLTMEERFHLRGPMDHQRIPGPDGGDGKAWWPPQPNIHIENAQYIMIGNDSQMSVDLGGVKGKDVQK